MQLRSYFHWWQNKASQLKDDVISLYYAVRHPGTPWYARVFVILIVAYAISPIDLIPDFIPVFGYLDDILLIPFGVLIAGKMIPAYVWAECRMTARSTAIPRSLYYLGIAIVASGWLGIAYFLTYFLP